ncbi:MAG TPA: fumarylacetoacetate hydrolase family protein [Gammaproteobacteria bacterium]|nr:fumarylacetoacetate hydrolase family protein [Gammaproteobacteria bacterium]
MPTSGPAPVTRIFCIGRNYAEHAKEMGNALPPEPVVFMKPATSLVPEGAPLVLPKGRGAVHHEMELVLAVGREGRDISPADALGFMTGVTLGLDLTLREVQARLKQAGAPWELAKAFDGSAAVGRLHPYPAAFDPQALDIRCTVNGVLRQQGNTRDMLFPIAAILSFLSRHWRLLPGDLVYTGTPAGVGPLVPGDRVEISSPPLGRFAWECS